MALVISTALIKILMEMAKKMLSQMGKRCKGQAGKGDVQFGQITCKGALIRLIFGIYTANLQNRQRR